MELTYKVLGADGKEYGPVTVAQMQAWVREGRVPPRQQVKRSDMEHWAEAGAFSELQETYTPPAAPVSAQPQTLSAAAKGGDPMAAARLKSCASWFYWIAALSLVNSIVTLTGSNFRFLFGLGITQIIDGATQGMGNGGKGVALALDVLVVGVLVFFGVFASKGQLWAFVIGGVLFALDCVIFIFAEQWLGVAFHAYVLFRLFQGFEACRQLRANRGG
jgi:hypothetical protein